MEALSLEEHSTFANEKKWAVVHRDVVDGKAATAEKEFVRDVNKKRSHIGVDYDTELTSTAELDKEINNELPDGNIITVGAKRFHCAEVLCQPNFTG